MSGPRIVVGPARLLPEGAASCDADVWRALAGGDDLLVPSEGPMVDWVRSFALGRGWPIEEIDDPRERIARDCPLLAPFVSILLPEGSPPPPQSLWVWALQVLNDLPQSAIPSKGHAEEIARWRIVRALSDADQTLLRVGMLEFSEGSAEAVAYEFAGSSTRDEVIARLVGDKSPEFAFDWDPARETELGQMIGKWAHARLSDSGFDGVRSSLMSTAPYSSKVAVSRAVAAVAVQVDLPTNAIRLLSPFLTGAEVERLAELIKPDAPVEVPHDATELSAWYRDSYLPYRRWMHAKGMATDDVIETIWEEFAGFYLISFAKALRSGQGDLALDRSRNLRQQSEGALLVVLDGPLPWDVERLLAQLKVKAQAWSVASFDWVLTSVPTVTEVCRPSVVSGVAATSVDKDDAVGTFAKARAEVIAEKEIVVLKLEQPDKAYHTLGEPPNRLRLLARLQMDLIAEELGELLISGNYRSVYITADHGRCMGPIAPTVAAPAGILQGRAALEVPRGSASDGAFAKVLNGDLLGFSKEFDSVVALGANGFAGSKIVWYLHGGLLPEEAFVPWIMLSHMVSAPDVRCEVQITGVLDRPGELVVNVRNHAAISVQLRHLEWQDGQQLRTYSLPTMDVPAANQRTIRVEIASTFDNYPSEGRIVVSTPDGSTYALPAQLSATVRRMQTQNIDLLDEL